MIYKDYELTRKQLTLLKCLQKNKFTDLNNFKDEDINFLIETEFIIKNNQRAFYKNQTSAPYYFLTKDGSMYILFSRKLKLNFFIPTTISILALLKSYQLELISVLQHIMKLLQ